ncbi:MAG: acyl-CoA dehydrogenase family protein [Nakamurella sp.]
MPDTPSPQPPRSPNQVPPLLDYDVSAADPALRGALAAAGSGLGPALTDLALAAGSTEMIEAARLADSCPPILRTHDRAGNRIDEVEYHPAWHTLMDRAVRAGLQAAPWSPDAPADAHLQRAAGFYLWTHTESGHLCPISMTYAAIPALRHSPALANRFEAGLRSRTYDFGLRPPDDKHGLLAGMSMTEKQGGSDLRQVVTTAVPDSGSTSDGAPYRLTGHKWFTSAPMNDVFLTLARAPAGLTCFLVPRVLPDGSRNGICLQRLKDKLGNRSNASAEIEYDDALGWRVGDEGRGLPTILEMVTMTRLDCVLGSAGQLRAALSQAAFYTSRRMAFGKPLAQQPAMTAVLADLAIESWAATATAIRLADLVQTSQLGAGGPAATALLRLALPVSKFWVCKRAVPVLAEALECLGGNGYVETFPMARLFRESPLNGIWEGSGTVTALDALRALHHSPAAGAAFLAELGLAGGINADFDRAVGELSGLLRLGVEPAAARRCASLAGRLLAAGLLIRQAPGLVADLYCATRLASVGDRVFGDLPGRPDAAGLLRLVGSVTPEIS